VKAENIMHPFRKLYGSHNGATAITRNPFVKSTPHSSLSRKPLKLKPPHLTPQETISTPLTFSPNTATHVLLIYSNLN
jgi:hypothetical protein